jgi:hypothetical protein
MSESQWPQPGRERLIVPAPEPERFEDIIGRHFRQPAEGLGLDTSATAHMWRTLIWPNNFL